MRAALSLLVLLPVCASAAALAGPEKPAEPKTETQPPVDPHAMQVLRDMTTYVGGLQSFRVISQAVDEVVLTNGTKIQSVTTSRISAHRPNELRSEQIGPGGNLAGWYDGKSLSLYCKTANTYGTVPAPPTIDAALDMARKKYEIDAPAADLLYNDALGGLTEDVKSAQYLGLEDIDGTPAHHLAFQQPEVDWQVWVQDGPKPLPVRYVITTKTMPSQPEFTAHLSSWEPDANLPADTFVFHAPPGAKHVDGLPASCPAMKR